MNLASWIILSIILVIVIIAIIIIIKNEGKCSCCNKNCSCCKKNK